MRHLPSRLKQHQAQLSSCKHCVHACTSGTRSNTQASGATSRHDRDDALPSRVCDTSSVIPYSVTRSDARTSVWDTAALLSYWWYWSKTVGNTELPRVYDLWGHTKITLRNKFLPVNKCSSSPHEPQKAFVPVNFYSLSLQIWRVPTKEFDIWTFPSLLDKQAHSIHQVNIG